MPRLSVWAAETTGSNHFAKGDALVSSRIVGDYVDTPRLKTFVRRTSAAGNAAAPAAPAGPTFVFIHGNTASSLFWEDTMLALPAGATAIAPDLRGYGRSESLPVDATRGVRDWSDDLHALLSAMDPAMDGARGGLNLVGWSLGAAVAMQYAIDYPGSVSSLTLVSPVSPYGYSGTHGVAGEPNYPDFAGSGAGGVNRDFIAKLIAKNKESGPDMTLPRNVVNATFYKPPFRSPREEEFLDEVMAAVVGDGNYPGSFAPSPNWPFYAPGDVGVLNAFSPKHLNLRGFVTMTPRPPVLWVRGADDQLVSDFSLADIAVLGKLGALPGWPGDAVCPPHPMVAQMRELLENYAASGGSFEELVFAGCGHSPHIEKPAEFVAALVRHVY